MLPAQLIQKNCPSKNKAGKSLICDGVGTRLATSQPVPRLLSKFFRQTRRPFVRPAIRGAKPCGCSRPTIFSESVAGSESFVGLACPTGCQPIFHLSCRGERSKSLFYRAPRKNRTPKGFCRAVFPGRSRQKAFLSLSREKQRPKSLFYHCSRRENDLNALFVLVPEKTGNQKAFGRLPRPADRFQSAKTAVSLNHPTK